MKNYLFYLMKSKLSIKVRGNNIERFIKRLNSNNIEIINIKYIKEDEVNIKIYASDYEKINSIKTIYEIETVNLFGMIKLKNMVLVNKFIIISVLFAIAFLYIITNLIFSISIVTNDSKMESILKAELEELGIKKYSFKKDYNKLQQIKKELLERHKSELEWIEIETLGTKYIIRYEPRIINDSNSETQLRHIVAKTDAVIDSMYISSGQIVKGVKSYVKKGDVIVSGYVELNGNIKDTVSANGVVYGETWKSVTITYPYKYYECTETGNKNKVFVIRFLNKEIELFNFNSYKTKNKIDNILLKNNILPIMFIYQLQKETKVVDLDLNEKQLIEYATNYSKGKLEQNLKDGEYIKDYKILSKIKNSDSITLNIFFNIVEDITDYQVIDEFKQELEQIE